MPHPSFFPGNNILLEKTTIHTNREDATAIQLQVGSDLTTMRIFSFDTWRPIIVSRYASDPLVMELLNKFELLRKAKEDATWLAKRAADCEENNSLADEPQTWQSIFS